MVDYSKWKNIDVSDDEDDTHPNIDTPSLFKWRHEARVERMQDFNQRKEAIKKEKNQREKELKECKEKLSKAKKEEEASSNLESIKKSLAEVEKKMEEAEKKEEAIKKEERLQPWNVDTISQPGFSKTIVNKEKPRTTTKTMTDEERESYMKEFVKKHEKDIKHFGWLQKFEESRLFLLDHPDLACEETANYLVIECLNLAMEEKFGAMEHVSHQVVAMQFLLELSKQLDRDPRSCISSFFSKIQLTDTTEYKKAFNDEIEAFRMRIRNRAKQKIEEQMAELEEEERKKRLGPGGLDPAEVFESLPKAMQECFETQDIAKLQQTIKAMPEEEARLHMSRCVQSGLWKPAADDPNTDPEDGFKRHPTGQDGDGELSSDEEEPEDEKIYEEVKEDQLD